MDPVRYRDDRLPAFGFPGRFSLSEQRSALLTKAAKLLVIVGDYEVMFPLQASA
jgi:hypothetical protein